MEGRVRRLDMGLAGQRRVLSGIRAFELDGVAEAFAAQGAVELERDGDGEWGGLVLAANADVAREDIR